MHDVRSFSVSPRTRPLHSTPLLLARNTIELVHLLAYTELLTCTNTRVLYTRIYLYSAVCRRCIETKNHYNFSTNQYGQDIKVFIVCYASLIFDSLITIIYSYRFYITSYIVHYISMYAIRIVFCILYYCSILQFLLLLSHYRRARLCIAYFDFNVRIYLPSSPHVSSVVAKATNDRAGESFEDVIIIRGLILKGRRFLEPYKYAQCEDTRKNISAHAYLLLIYKKKKVAATLDYFFILVFQSAS